ncbi:MAG TPA: hypothetical protein VGN20_10350 [Mucilaginibacter sp.]|jgi:hypothetical protein
MEKTDKTTPLNCKQEGIPPIPKQHRMKKLYTQATGRSGHTTQKADNSLIESAYMRVLAQVKGILAKPSLLVFERDQRVDNTHNAFTVHSFLCRSFFFELSCDISCNFYVEYSFPSHPFPEKETILKLLLTYSLDTRAKEIELKPDFNTFCDAVFKLQDKKFISLL